MTIAEFSKLTKTYPDSILFRKINDAYMETDLSKEDFCKAYKANKDCIAERCAHQASDELFKIQETYFSKDEVDELKAQIADLRAQVAALREESEQRAAENQHLTDELTSARRRINELEGWKRYEDKDAYTQDAYIDLSQSSIADQLTDDDAKTLVADEFGFNPDRIKILHEAPVYSINGDKRIRVDYTTERLPYSASSDWNYVRFQVTTKASVFTYEMQDGELKEISM